MCFWHMSMGLGRTAIGEAQNRAAVGLTSAIWRCQLHEGLDALLFIAYQM